MYSKALRLSIGLKRAGLCTGRAVLFCWLSGVLVFLAASPARGVSYFQDGFNYPPGALGNNAPWTSPTNLISVTTNSLTYPYLADFSPPANAVAVLEGNKSVTYCPLTTPATNGAVYFSFLINFTTVPGNYYIAGLTQSTNIPPGGTADDPLDLVDGSLLTNTGATFGVRAMGGTTSYLSNGTYLNTNNGDWYVPTNTTSFVVMKYNFTNGQASLYVNPPAGNTEPSTPDAASTAAQIVTNLAYVYLRVGSTNAGNFMISALRVASTWAEVTPATNATTAYSNATMFGAFLDSLQVEDYWSMDTNVNWLTGAPGPLDSGPNQTIGAETHCSAFAAAVADLMNIYILRQPQASDLNLANHQAMWLATNTMGWTNVVTPVEAQHLANSGNLVVASYENPDTNVSGHIAVLRPSNRTDVSVNLLGPEECQSGSTNYNDTVMTTGFPGQFPESILFYSHAVTYPIAMAGDPVFTQSYINTSNQFVMTASTAVGRTYIIQGSSDLTNWANLLTFTNSNNSTNF
jgi:hypothetical protein